MPSLICSGAENDPLRFVFVNVRMILGAKIMSERRKKNADVPRKNWVLTENAWEKLLHCLSPDPEAAAVQYEKIRERLIRLFEWRNLPHPDELADRAINRVAQKIDEGVEIRSEDRYPYFYTVACLVAKEEYRSQKRRNQALLEHRQQPSHEADDASGETETRLKCLQHCIATLPPEQRDLVLKYHAMESAERIPHRRKMAKRLELPLNALRIRACRIRAKLEACIERCHRRAEDASA